jgi:hypothetical protein
LTEFLVLGAVIREAISGRLCRTDEATPSGNPS